MIRALINIVRKPQEAWARLTIDSYLQHFMPLLLVLPLLLLATITAYLPYLYGFIDFSEASKDAVITFMKIGSCILCGWVIIVMLGRYYYASQCNKRELYLFTCYAHTITILTAIVGNILPSDFSFVQLIPMYLIWVVYEGRHYAKIPGENVFSYTVTTSAVMIGLPYIWESFFNILLH